MSLPVLREERRSAQRDEDIDAILGASTGEFEVESDMDGGSVADHDLDELLGESTGDFRLDMSGGFSVREPPREEMSKKELVSAHLSYLARRRTSSSALDDVRARIRALTIEKQKLYRALAR